MSTTTTHDELQLRRAYGAVAVCGVLMAALCLLSFGVSFGLSVLAGTAVALGNLWVLARTVRNLLAGSGTSVPWSAVAVLKFFALFGVTYLLVRSPAIEALGLTVGFVALPLGLVFGSLLQAPPDASAAARLSEESDHA
jgi:hypothetical protein